MWRVLKHHNMYIFRERVEIIKKNVLPNNIKIFGIYRVF